MNLCPAIAAGTNFCLAMRNNGMVAAWGANDEGQLDRPADLTNTLAIAAGWNHNLALLTNGTVSGWGVNGDDLDWHLLEVPGNLTNATAISAGALHSLALRSNGTVTAWGDNASGQTNVPANLSNVVAIAAGGQHNLALKQDGTVVGWDWNNSGQCNVPSGLSNVMAIAAGWQHSVGLKNDGSLVTWGGNSNGQTNIGNGIIEGKMISARGDHTLVSRFSPLVQYPVDVSKDLLLIYNTNSADSIFVKDYYLAHRPMVANANVLGIGCSTNEAIRPADFTNTIDAAVQTWLSANPTKRPQYVILFPDIPSQVNTNNVTSICGWDPDHDGATPSVQYRLHALSSLSWRPFVTSINMRTTNDCVAYIDKLEYFGTSYSQGRLLISANLGGYANTNYLVDDAAGISGESRYVTNTISGLLQNGITSSGITYASRGQPHITQATNVAGYISWGVHGGLSSEYATNGTISFYGQSDWHLIQTIESFNGQRCNPSQGTFLKWFSSNAFGGTNYVNTPIGAVTHVWEPSLGGVNDSALYFGLWAQDKNFAICSWNSFVTGQFQAVGDPFTKR